MGKGRGVGSEGRKRNRAREGGKEERGRKSNRERERERESERVRERKKGGDMLKAVTAIFFSQSKRVMTMHDHL